MNEKLKRKADADFEKRLDEYMREWEASLRKKLVASDDEEGKSDKATDGK